MNVRNYRHSADRLPYKIAEAVSLQTIKLLSLRPKNHLPIARLKTVARELGETSNK